MTSHGGKNNTITRRKEMNTFAQRRGRVKGPRICLERRGKGLSAPTMRGKPQFAQRKGVVPSDKRKDPLNYEGKR